MSGLWMVRFQGFPQSLWCFPAINAWPHAVVDRVIWRASSQVLTGAPRALGDSSMGRREEHELVDIGGEQAILLGRYAEVDGHAGRPLRFVTHFHSDHTVGLQKSARTASMIIATPATLEALKVLGHRIPEDRAVPLEYRRSLYYDGERYTLLPARHVFGSAQVVVETLEGRILGYTGDFKTPGTPVLRDLDYMVVDATYAAPGMVRGFKHEIDQLLADLVRDLLSTGQPIRVRCYHGKMQEAMELLRGMGIDAPFLMPRKPYQLTRVAVKHGARISDFHPYDSEEGREILRSGWFVYFQHLNSRSPPPFEGGVDVVLTGWLFEDWMVETKWNGRRTIIVAFSDHADYEDLLAHIDDSRPRRLAVDATRTDPSAAKRLAERVEAELGIPSTILPRSGRPSALPTRVPELEEARQLDGPMPPRGGRFPPGFRGLNGL